MTSENSENKDACCSGHGSDKHGEGKHGAHAKCTTSCCGVARNWITGVAVAVAVAAVVYAGTSERGMDAAPAKLTAEQVATLIQGDDSVVARLNGRDIYKSQVAAAIRELGANVPPENVDQVLPAFIQQYINLQLINDAAKAAGVTKDETVRSQISNSREQIVRAAYMRDLFEGAVSDDVLRQAYQARYEAQPMPQEVHARHILVDDEALARDIIAQLKGGANFAKLAEAHSKDPTASRAGDLGYFVQAEMVPEFGEAVFAMKSGELTEQPIRTQFGWHVVKVEDKRQRVKPSYEEARVTLDQEARQAILDAKLNELRAAAKIELLGEEAETAIDEALDPAAENEAE